MIDFSVLIPVYNTKAHHLLESVDSILNQSIRKEGYKYSIVLVDDGSTNADTKFALQYVRTLPGVKVFTHDTNLGTSAALNTGHKLIESTWIAIQGSDDISHPDRFFLQTKFLNNTKQPVDVLGANITSFYDSDIFRTSRFKSNHVQDPTPAVVNKHGWQTNHGTVFYRNQSVKDVGGYDVKFRRGQDVNLWNRMMAAGKKFKNLHDNLYMWRRMR